MRSPIARLTRARSSGLAGPAGGAMRGRLARACAGLALAVSVLAGCGGGGGAGSGAMPGGADLVAAGTPVFVSLASDFEGDQWQTVEALAERFPSGAEALDELFAGLSSEGIDFETELKPALGPELDVAVFDLDAEEPTAVVLTEPTDPAKLEALLAESEQPLFWREVDGWYAVAELENALDRALAGSGDSLADTEAFDEAMGELPGDALARIYVDGAAATAAFEQQGESSGLDVAGLAGLGSAGEVRWAGVALVAQGDGVRLEGVIRSEGAPEIAAHAAELPGTVPADALVYASFNGLDEGLSKLLDTAGQETPGLDQQIAQAESLLGISVQEDILPIFAGEGAVYVRAGLPIPEVTLLLSPEDPDRAMATLEALISAVSAFGVLGSDASASGDDTTTEAPTSFATPVTIAGVSAKKISFSDEFTLYYAVVDGRLVATTAEKGIADLANDVPRLAEDADFKKASEAAGLPEETLGFVYVDLQDAVSLLELAGALGSVDASELENLKPLDFLLMHAGGSTNEIRFGGFFGIA